MKIWLLEDGERTGPHEIFTVRDKISNREVNAETLAWYEGVDGWVKLSEVPAYASNFPKSQTNASGEEVSESGISEQDVSEFVKQLEDKLNEGLSPNRAKPNSATFQNEPLHPVRRFFARFLDIALYSIAVFFIKLQMGINPLEVDSLSRELMFQLPYLVVDGLALSYFGTTLGKWLLDIKLHGPKGQKIKLGSGIIRSARVWVLGFAMQTFFILISLPFSWFVASKYGKFIWDIPQNYITECKPIKPMKVVLYIAVIIGAGVIMQNFVPSEYMPTMENYKLYNS